MQSFGFATPLSDRGLLAHRKRMSPSHRCTGRHAWFFAAVAALAMFPCSRARGQMPIYCSFVPGGIRNGMKFIGGTTFPWTGRTENVPITLTGGIDLSQNYSYGGPALSVSNVTVTVNNQSCVVTADPNDPSNLRGTFKYNGPVITVPNTAAVYSLTFAAYYNDNVMWQYGQPTVYTYHCNVCKVASDPDSNLIDYVSTGQ